MYTYIPKLQGVFHPGVSFSLQHGTVQKKCMCYLYQQTQGQVRLLTTKKALNAGCSSNSYNSFCECSLFSPYRLYTLNRSFCRGRGKQCRGTNAGIQQGRWAHMLQVALGNGGIIGSPCTHAWIQVSHQLLMQCKDLFDVAEQRLNDLFRETVVMLTLLASLLQQVLGSKTSYHLSQHSLI